METLFVLFEPQFSEFPSSPVILFSSSGEGGERKEKTLPGLIIVEGNKNR